MLQATQDEAHAPLSAHDLLDLAEQSLAAQHDAMETSWTPGQVCGAVLDYLEVLESTPPQSVGAGEAAAHMRRLTSLLHKSVDRTVQKGLDPRRLSGLYDALSAHALLLEAERGLHSVDTEQARSLIRMEIAYLATPHPD